MRSEDLEEYETKIFRNHCGVVHSLTEYGRDGAWELIFELNRSSIMLRIVIYNIFDADSSVFVSLGTVVGRCEPPMARFFDHLRSTTRKIVTGEGCFQWCSK